MTNPYLVDKPVGATPLEALLYLRKEKSLSDDTKLSYAGRLDPMASGLLVVLHGELLKNQEKFWGLQKTYEASFAFGVGTDSYDVLGLAEMPPARNLSASSILSALGNIVGKTNLAVPAYSSYKYKGKPLFQWARDNEKAEIPVRRMSVSELVVHDVDKTDLGAISKIAIEKVALVRGDFRQEQITERWKELAKASGKRSIYVARVTIQCAAGTYIRSLAHEIGLRLKTEGILLELRRTVVGPYRIDSTEVVKFAWPQ